jgi:hypothetical protein
MTKKYNAKELEIIIKNVLCNAYEHMESIIKELKKYEPKPEGNLSPDDQARFKVMNLTMTLVNDVIHPAHKISYKFFKGYEPMLDLYVKNQKIAFDKKLVPDCFNACCDADGSRSYAKAQELASKSVMPEGDSNEKSSN